MRRKQTDSQVGKRSKGRTISFQRRALNINPVPEKRAPLTPWSWSITGAQAVGVMFKQGHLYNWVNPETWELFGGEERGKQLLLQHTQSNFAESFPFRWDCARPVLPLLLASHSQMAAWTSTFRSSWLIQRFSLDTFWSVLANLGVRDGWGKQECFGFVLNCEMRLWVADANLKKEGLFFSLAG